MNKLFYISLFIVIVFAAYDYINWRECMALGEDNMIEMVYDGQCHLLVDGAWIKVKK